MASSVHLAEFGLCVLLRDTLFKDEPQGYRQWLSRLPDADDIVANLPGQTASSEELVATSVRLLRNRGRINADFFYRLIRERPAQRAAIRPVMESWATTTSMDDSTTVSPEAGLPDITAALRAHSDRLELSNYPHGPAPVVYRLEIVGAKVKSRHLFGPLFTPPLKGHLGPKAELAVEAPHYLAYSGTRKRQTIDLRNGPNDFVVVQSQPSIRRATIIVCRGLRAGEHVLFDLPTGAKFTVEPTLPGLVVALAGADCNVPPSILWFQEAV